MAELQAGITVTLNVSRQIDFGWFLSNGEEEVFLHDHEVAGEISEGDDVEVFLYFDSKGRLSSTMTIPEITIDSYGWAKVVDVNPSLGVFVDIGIQKDMLVSMDDLPLHTDVWPEIDDQLYVTLKEGKNNRLYAKMATEDVINEMTEPAGQELFNKNITATVYRVIVEGSHIITLQGIKGFIHRSERKREPRLGETVIGRVIAVKEDGTVNVSLLPRKQEAMDEDAETIYRYMESRGGAMPYWDKSFSEDITARFHMSKSAFKRALGKLMKEQKVYQEDGWTYFTDKNKE